MKKIIGIATLTLIVSGCMLGPTYTPPKIEAPDTWEGEKIDKEAPLTTSAPNPAWWNLFKDPLLSKYIAKATACNFDLLSAEAAIMEARGLRHMVSSNLYPKLTVDTNASRTAFSQKGPLFNASSLAAGGTGALTNGAQIPRFQNLFNALIDASWEIDFFGKTRRHVEAADAYVESKIEEKNGVTLTLLADVAQSYLQIRRNQQWALLLEENIDLLRKNLMIAKRQRGVGYINQLKLEAIEADLAQLCSALPTVKADIYRNIYSLSILTGNYPETLFEELLPLAPLPKPPEVVAIGLRSDLLRRRPDVRQKERALAEATAAIGAAVAAFFPSVNLLGNGGFQSLKIRDLFKGAAKTWSFGADITMPLFQGGRLIGQLRATEAATAAACYTYRQTVLNALEEAESSLITFTEDLKTTSDLDQSTDHTRNLVRLTKYRFDSGLVSLIQLLDAQRQLNASEQTLLKSRSTTLLDLIKLYKALGGGWEVPPCK